MHGFLSFLSSLYKALFCDGAFNQERDTRYIQSRTRGQRTRTVSETDGKQHKTEANKASRTTLLPRSLWIFGRFEGICIWESCKRNPRQGSLHIPIPIPNPIASMASKPIPIPVPPKPKPGKCSIPFVSLTHCGPRSFTYACVPSLSFTSHHHIHHEHRC